MTKTIDRPTDAEIAEFFKFVKDHAGELSALSVMFVRPAYSIKEWARAVCLSPTVVYEATRSGELVSIWPTKTKQIIRLEDGLKWLASRPTEKPDAA